MSAWRLLTGRVPTSQGVALSAPSCGGCHTYYSRTGEAFPEAPCGGGQTFRVSPLKTETDRIDFGRTTFEQVDHMQLRIYDPKFTPMARQRLRAGVRPDGTATNMPCVPTKEGVALTFPNCANCHLFQLQDGSFAPSMAAHQSGWAPSHQGMWLYRTFGMPWQSNDVDKIQQGESILWYRI